MALTDPASPLPPSRPDYEAVCTDVVRLVQAAREGAARSVNAWMTATYWLIGRRIVESDQGGKRRAAYGSGLLKRLSEELSRRFGRGFGMVNLQQMRQFYLAWPPKQIDQTLSDQFKRQGGPRETAAELSDLARASPLPWSAYVRLLSVRSQRARRFYEREALRCGWSVRQLARQINSQFYERALLSRNKAGMLKGATVAETDDLVTAEEAITMRSVAWGTPSLPPSIGRCCRRSGCWQTKWHRPRGNSSRCGVPPRPPASLTRQLAAEPLGTVSHGSTTWLEAGRLPPATCPQPVLRSPAAIPLIVRWMPRRTRTSSPSLPAR